MPRAAPSKPAKTKARTKSVPKTVEPVAMTESHTFPEPGLSPDLLRVPRNDVPQEVRQDVFQDGDFAGFPVDDVLEGLYQQITDVFGEMDIDTVKIVTHRHIDELMPAIQLAQGNVAAKKAAVLYGQSLLPFMLLDVPEEHNLYKTIKAQLPPRLSPSTEE